MRDYLLKIARALNALLLLTVVGMLLFGQTGSMTGGAVLLIVLVILTPAFTLFALQSPEN